MDDNNDQPEQTTLNRYKSLSSSRANIKVLGASAIAVVVVALLATIGPRYGWWQAGCAVLGVGIACTLAPIIYSFLSFQELYDPGDWFNTASQLGPQQERVAGHYSRITGPLRFWKNKAAAHHRLHLARVFWSLISAVSLPVLIQHYDRSNDWSVLFMTTLTTWTGLVVALAYTFKSEERFQGFRQQESDFYDASRDLLDSVSPDDPDLREKVDAYIELVKSIRKFARHVETGSPPSAR